MGGWLPGPRSLNRAGRASALALHPRTFGGVAESLPATAGDPHSAFGLIGPPQTRSQRGCDSRGRPVRSPGPAAPFGNDFYALTLSANHRVCKERVGGDFGRPVRSPGPAASFGNDFYAPTRLPVFWYVRKELAGILGVLARSSGPAASFSNDFYAPTRLPVFWYVRKELAGILGVLACSSVTAALFSNSLYVLTNFEGQQAEKSPHRAGLGAIG